MEEYPGADYENKDIPINIFESLQIDLKPVKPKKRRKTDDYDYDDPFLEPFEGEFDVVELECKLENFFVYKGTMEDDPKRIARKYNNSLKKTKLVDALTNMDRKLEVPASHGFLFEFERMLSGAFNPSSKYKKESKFENALMWMVFMEDPKDNVEYYLRCKLLSLYDSKKYGFVSKHADPNELKERLKSLKNEIEAMFKGFLMAANDDKNFFDDKRSFSKFKEDKFVELMLDFCIKYMKYYAALTNESLQYVKNRALGYLSAMLPEQCTNKIKLKHYLSKAIHNKIEDNNYNLKNVIEGEFVKDPLETTSQHKKLSLVRDVNSDSDQLAFTSTVPPTVPVSPNSSNTRRIKKQDFTKKALSSSFSSKVHQYVHPTKPVFSSTFIKTDLLDNTLNKNIQGSIVEESNTTLMSSNPPSSPVCTSDPFQALSRALDFSKSTDSSISAEDKKDVPKFDSLSASATNSPMNKITPYGELKQQIQPLIDDSVKAKRGYTRKDKQKALDTNKVPSLQNNPDDDPVFEKGMDSQAGVQFTADSTGPRAEESCHQQPILEACTENEQSALANNISAVKAKRRYTKRMNRSPNHDDGSKASKHNISHENTNV